ncbi:hypothetical protein F5Y05DRAFT_403935 [Hypoxylon sp. FL0543]|nr:hypothetical protein F5Y05DRAFT_403935 [Hypoxylon sp. FL0543]
MGSISEHPVLDPTGTVATKIRGQQIRAEHTKALPTFYRNLEEALDVKRASHGFYSIAQNNWQTTGAVDLCSGDILGLGASKARRAEFLAELARHPDFSTGSSGVRLMDGNYTYLEQAERDIAAFHGAEAGLMVGSAYEANVAVWTAVVRPGDVVVYDYLVHASTHEGIKQSLAMQRIEFAHSDVDAFRDTLLNILDTQPLIKQGKRTVLVALESIYSMDGDVCPLLELLEVSKEVFPDQGHIQFVVDEAHSVGVIGPKGAGLVCLLGLEKEIAVVVHSFGKAMGATGAIILGNESVRNTIVNFAQSVIFTTSPSFPFVAAIKSGYALLAAGQTAEAQERIQTHAALFFEELTSHHLWSAAKKSGLLSVPLARDWEDRDFLTHIVTVGTRQNYIWWLYFHLLFSGFCVFPVDYPVVPQGQARLRVILHAGNTPEQIRGFVDAMFAWVSEMTEIETGHSVERVSSAASVVYAWMAREGTLSSKGGHFVNEDPAAFDAPFFSITSKEAASMDPQQRWLLETSYRALENAGIPAEKAAGTDTAVFAASMSEDYMRILVKDPDEAPTNIATGTCSAMLANRLSWYFDLKGPSVEINTACSSSMVAMDLACQSLQTGQTSMSLVTGSNVLLSPETSVYMSNMNFLSPDSLCYSFDHRANGYARGEGVVVVVLKRLPEAIRDGDMIRAVIRATGTNQDGHTPGITQPSLSSQEELIRKVYRNCGLGFESTRYVEAHGTGTLIGDFTEAKALGRVFRSSRGSVKANIGHTGGASGLAGILKCIFILERGIIPPNALFEKLNPKINAKANNFQFEIPTSSVPWPTKGLRRVSVNSFGFGGSNGHIVMDDAFHTLMARGLRGKHNTVADPIDYGLPSPLTTAIANGTTKVNGTSTGSKYQPLVWSARDVPALQRMFGQYSRYCEMRIDGRGSRLEQLAYTLASRRSEMAWRFFTVLGREEMLKSRDFSAANCVRASRERGITFVFTGQGAQYAAMGLELIQYPVFKSTLALADDCLKSLGAKWSLFDKLLCEESIHTPEISQPLCTVLQIALVELLRSFGIIPDVVVGHSSGEIASAYTLGALSLESACKVAYHRGRLAQSLKASTSKSSAMMSVNLAECDVHRYLAKATLEPGIHIACVNSPLNVTLSGEECALDVLKGHLDRDGIFAQKLKTGVAYHSPAMQQIAEEYRAVLGSLVPRDQHSAVMMVSSVIGQRISASAVSNSQYWVDNLISPVRFADALRYVAVASPKRDKLRAMTDYVEIGPHGALRRPVTDTLKEAIPGTSFRYTSVLSRFDSPVKTTLNFVGRLFAHGYPVSITAANALDSDMRDISFLVDAPGYPFDKSQSYWHESRLSEGWRLREDVPRSLLGTRSMDWNPLEPRWRKQISVEEIPWVADHVVGENVFFPATGMIMMALGAVKEMSDEGQTLCAYNIKECTFMSPIVIRPERKTEVMIHLTPLRKPFEKAAIRFDIRIFARVDGYWKECFKATCHIEYEDLSSEVDGGHEFRTAAGNLARDDAHARHNCKKQIREAEFYRWLSRQGLNYGKTFAIARDVYWDGDRTATGCVNVGSLDTTFEGVVHPAILDAAFQVGFAGPSGGMTDALPTFIPHKMTDMWIAAEGWRYPRTSKVRTLAKSKLKARKAGIQGTLSIISDDGIPLCRIGSFELLPVMGNESTNQPKTKMVHTIDWKPQLSLLSPDQLRSYHDATKIAEDQNAVVGYCVRLERGLRSVLYANAAHLEREKPPMVPSHMSKYTSASTMEESDAAKKPSWRIFIEVAQNFLSILDGNPLTLDSLEIAAQEFEEELLNRTCDQRLKILELGAGTGVFTCNVLLVLYLDAAQKLFDEYRNHMTFKTLDLELDITRQGFPTGVYDLIVVGDVFCSIKNLPGGKLIFFQLVSPMLLAINFAFRVLPKWWCGEEKYRTWGPTLTESAWDALLKETGFSGNDLVIRDHPDRAAHYASIIVSTVQVLLNKPTESFRVLLVVDDNDNHQKSIASALERTLCNSLTLQPRVLSITQFENENLEPSDSVVYLADFGGSLLAEPTATSFELLKSALLRSKTLLDCAPLRTLRAEFSAKRLISLTFEGSSQDVLAYANSISQVINSTFRQRSSEAEYLVRDGKILIGRLVEETKINLELTASTSPEVMTEACCGQLETLCFNEDFDYYTDLGPIEVEIKAKAWAVNFRDIFYALGRLEEGKFGSDYTSIVTRDRVGMAVVPISNPVSFEKAYAIMNPAYIAWKGEKILIYVALGGTVSAELLINLYNILANYIFYSKNAYGVDIVLNSLVGKGLIALWECVAPYRWFIKIGKADINANSTLLMALDVQQIIIYKKELARELFQKTMEISAAGSICRIIIRVDPSTVVQKQLSRRRTWTFDENATYLVAGGFGGIGRSVLRWMASKGARNLLVLTRSGIASDAAAEVVEELSREDILVVAPACDVSSLSSLSSTLEEYAKAMPPIRGCINATMVLNDSIFEQMTHAQWESTVRSKIHSSWNFHTMLPDLDFFILLSSISGIVGNPGQSNYAAGCTFQDALARYRSDHGQNAISIDLGVMRTVGVVAESESLQKHFENSQGFAQIEEKEFLSLLNMCCDPVHPVTTSQITMGLVTPADLQVRSVEPLEIMRQPLYAHFSQARHTTPNLDSVNNFNPGELFKQLETVEDRINLVVQSLSIKLARALSIQPEEVDTEQPLHAFGVDSLVAVELRNWIAREFAADVAVFEIMGGRTVKAIGELVTKSSQIKMPRKDGEATRLA